MVYEVIGKSLRVLDTELYFDYDIDNVKEAEDLLIVLLDIPANVQFCNNVYAVNSKGKIVWQIEDAGRVYSVANDVPYVGTRVVSSGKIIVTNFNGVTYTVELSNGKIIDRGITK